MIFPDKQMMLFSKDILKDKSGGIVFDVKCSNHLENIISSNGGKPIMSPTGHFHIKNAIKKNNALLGGEMSCLLYTSPSPRDATLSRMPSSA